MKTVVRLLLQSQLQTQSVEMNSVQILRISYGHWSVDIRLSVKRAFARLNRFHCEDTVSSTSGDTLVSSNISEEGC